MCLGPRTLRVAGRGACPGRARSQAGVPGCLLRSAPWPRVASGPGPGRAAGDLRCNLTETTATLLATTKCQYMRANADGGGRDRGWPRPRAPRTAPAPAAGAPGLRARVRARVPTGPATRTGVAAAAQRPRPAGNGAVGKRMRGTLPGGRPATPRAARAPRLQTVPERAAGGGRPGASLAEPYDVSRPGPAAARRRGWGGGRRAAARSPLAPRLRLRRRPLPRLVRSFAGQPCRAAAPSPASAEPVAGARARLHEGAAMPQRVERADERRSRH